MAHLIFDNDNMISGNNETPWHGKGEIKGIITVPDAYRVLGWNVVKEELVTQQGEKTGTYATIRVGTEKDPMKRIILGNKLSNDYNILQNIRLIQAVQPLLDAGMKLETLGSLEDGKVVWLLASFQGDLIIGKSDRIKRYVLISNDHAGRAKPRCGLTGVRVVCNNTIVAAHHEGSLIKLSSHRAKEADMVRGLEDIIASISVADKKFVAYGETMERLIANKAVSSADVRKYVKDVIFHDLTAEEEKQKADRIRTVTTEISRLFEAGPGATTEDAKGTAYGLYHAVNNWLNYHSAARDRQASLVFGSNAQTDARALKQALVLSAA